MKMSTLPQEALSAKECLKRHHIIVPDEWITACIDFLHDECNGEAIPQGTLNESVYEQWLNSDLHMLQSMCLPANLIDQMKIILNGHFVLQVDEVIDVSQSAYQQLHKLRGEDNENVLVSADVPAKKQPKPSRMLMLKLTDGMQTVQGMEYKNIPQLDVNTKPGSKILVHGKIQCRKGVLFLTKDAVTVLGGEVDNLAEANTPMRVLARTLGQEETLGQLDQVAITANAALNNPALNGNSVTTVAVPRAEPQAPEVKRARLSTTSTTCQRLIPPPSSVNQLNGKQMSAPSGELNNGFPDDDDIFPDAAGFDWATSEMDFDEGDIFQDQERAVSPVFQPVVKITGNSTLLSSFGVTSNNSAQATPNYGVAKVVSGNGVTKSVETHNGHSVKRKSLTLSKKKSDPSVRNVLQPKTLDNFFTSKGSVNVSTPSVQSNKTSVTRISTASNFSGDDWDDFDVACQNLDESIFSNKGGSSGVSNTTPNQSQSRLGVKPTFSESKLVTKVDRRRDISESDTSDTRSNSVCDVVVIEDNSVDNVDLMNNSLPFTTIYEIKRRPAASSSLTETFVVRGFIATILSSLKPTDDGWNLPAKICDGTGQLEVVLTNQLLEPMIGHKARNKQTLKAMAKENPQYKETLKDAAVKCQVKLMNLCALLELTFTPNETPSVIGYKPVTSSTLLSLQTPKKLSQSSGTSLGS